MTKKAIVGRIIIFLVMVGLCGFFYWTGYHNGYSDKTVVDLIAKKIDTENKLTQWVYVHSSRISIDTAKVIVKEVMKTDKPLLTLAHLAVESGGFNPSAMGNAGEIGLSQIMWVHHGDALRKMKIANEPRDLFNISTSIQAGSFILNDKLKETKGDLTKALIKYRGKDGGYVNQVLINAGALYALVGTT